MAAPEQRTNQARMTFEIGFVLVVLAVAIVLFATGRVAVEIIAVGTLLALFAAGTITLPQALQGFANSAVVTIGAVMVMSHGLSRTGVAYAIGQRIGRLAGRSEARLIAITMLTAGLMSGFMNTIAAAAVLLPAVVAAAREMDTPISRVLLPLSYATLMGSMLTLVGTPSNLLVDSVVVQEGMRPLELFEFTPFGVALLVTGIAVVVFLRRRLLPARPAGAETAAMLPVRHDEHEPYRLEERLYEVSVPPGSDLAGASLRESEIRSYGISVFAIDRAGGRIVSPGPETTMLPGDRLILSARDEDLRRLLDRHALELQERPRLGAQTLHSEANELVEVALTPRSELVGQTLASVAFRERFGLNVLGIWREGAPRRTHLTGMELRAGDAMLLQGPLARIEDLDRASEFVVLSEKTGVRFRTHLGPLAVLILLGFVVALVLRLAPVPIVALGAAAAMLATGCVRPREAHEAVDWRVIVLIAGMLALAEAMRASGAAELLAEGIASGLGASGALVVMVGLMLLTSGFTHVMGNHVTAVLMAPIALNAAGQLGADPHMFAISIALAASTGFVTPYAHPGNLLIMGPGNYRFMDYVRAGLPLLAVVLAVDFTMLWLLFAR